MTEATVYAALERMYRAPAYIMLAGVRNQTGYSRRVRTADAVAVSVFPSRGLFAIGFEIKTARGDWKRELADPEKSEEIMQYCRQWFVAAPAGVVMADEVPQTWGHIEVGDKRSRVIVKAPVLQPQVPSWAFVCSVLRTASFASVPAHSVSRRIEEVTKQVLGTADDIADRKTKAIRETIKTFEDASGIKIGERWDAGRIGKAVKLVLDVGCDDLMRQVRYAVSACENVAKIGREAIAGFGEKLAEEDP